jgi:hypothetical protein
MVLTALPRKKERIMRKSASDQFWQFKITLNGVNPPIWRRIQVAKCTLAELHDHIQLAMGWQNAHLYQFTINGVLYSDPTFSDEDAARLPRTPS